MLEGFIKSKLDAIREDFYNANETQEVAKHLTMLIFTKLLDDRQLAVEANAQVLGVEPDESKLVFKHGIYQNYETINGQKILRFEIPYEDLRWHNFKNLNSEELNRRLRDYVIPFIKDATNDNIGSFAKFAKSYSFAFDGKERLLTKVIDKLSDPEFDFTKTDVTGDIYEYICGSGVTGQFRTPRHIIDMGIEMMKPKLGEKIIDPAMGTAGFLIEAAKYIEEHQKVDLLNKENKEKYDNQFTGCDTDSNMARIGYMNCILHNIGNPNVSMGSLLEEENLVQHIGEYDLILQNPPFAGSIDEKTISEKVTNVCNTKSTELLFVALSQLLLKKGGRFMSVIPDGVLFGSDNAHLSLRKQLVDNQKLIGIISMPQGIFNSPGKKGSNSKGAGVKTSYLIYQKTDKPATDYVWFYNIQNDGFSLNAKREAIEGSDIPNAIKSFEQLEVDKEKYKKLKDEETKALRKTNCFFVSKEEIAEKNYVLTLNTYKEREQTTIAYRKTSEIKKDIIALEKEISDLNNSLYDLIKEDEEEEASQDVIQ